MNLAIIIPALGGGGAERVAQIIGNYYFEKGDNVYYFLFETSIKQVYPVKGKVINTGIKRYTENISYGNIQVIQRVIKSSMAMRNWKKKFRIDVAISFMEEANYINILSKGKEKVITRICTILSQRKELNGIIYNRGLIHVLYNLSDKVIVMSDYAIKEMHEQYGISYRKLRKIPNPSIKHEQEGIEKEWIYGDQAVICVGRLEPVKQQERIIRAFSYAKFFAKEAKLLILGTGPNKKYLEGLCKKYKIDKDVFFIGFTRNVGFYLKNSKVFVSASQVEGFSNSIVEAMAYGVPIITTDCPGACGEIAGKKHRGNITDIQYCNYGIVVPNIAGRVKGGNDLSQEELFLGEAIVKILNNKELYEKYRIQSLKRASTYSMKKIEKMWDAVIEN